MIYNLPLRRTTLHFAQRLRMDGATFMMNLLLTTMTVDLHSQSLDYTRCSIFRPVGRSSASRLQDSQEEGLSFGDGN